MPVRSIDPADISTADLHQYLVGAVAPRPIAFASTRSKDGQDNLAPYSFFNVFSSRPPILVFSSNRRVRGNTTKDTLANVIETGEVVINVVSHRFVHQMAIASIEYPPEVSEFAKSGLTPLPSDRVAPFRVSESPVQFECKVLQILPLGEEGGAGNLIICEVLRMHLDTDILDDRGRIDPHKIDLMGRMGMAYYCRASGSGVFPIVQPQDRIGMGVDQLPEHIRLSHVLSGNDLARLASLPAIPVSDGQKTIDAAAMDALAGNTQEREAHLHRYAKQLIEAGEVVRAWEVLMWEEG
ncbi:MAG: flavin reductase family protein [Bacteroidia bacterium]